MSKACKQCGDTKPNEQFRKYYGGRKGRYSTCVTCERINSREKYLTRKGDNITVEEREELHKIHKLYEAQRKIGLQPPRRDAGLRSVPLSESLDDMLDVYEARVAAVEEVGAGFEINDELTHWLVAELTEDPEYYTEEVYEQLRSKFRPVVRLDEETKLPVYDETYRAVLEKILERFNDYEDAFYAK